MSGQMDQLQRMVQQVFDNNKPAAEAASNIEGPGRSTRQQQGQKLELVNDAALWRKLGPRGHYWFIRGRIPPRTGESVAELQAMLGDMLEVTPEVAQLLAAPVAGQIRDLGISPAHGWWLQRPRRARSKPVRFVASSCHHQSSVRQQQVPHTNARRCHSLATQLELLGAYWYNRTNNSPLLHTSNDLWLSYGHDLGWPMLGAGPEAGRP